MDKLKRPRLLCLPADSFKSLPKLGVGSFIWQHYAPKGFFEKVVFAYLDDQNQALPLDDEYSVRVFRKRWGNALPFKAFFYTLRIPYFTLCLVNLILREQIDVVRARSASYNALAGVLAAKLTGRPVAISIHAPYADDRKLANRSKLALLEEAIVEKLSIRFADRIYGVSTAMCDYAIGMGASPKKAQVLFNRVNVNKFQKQNPNAISKLKAQLDIQSDERVLLTVGRLVPQKDPTTLLQAFKKLRSSNASYKLINIGIGYLQSEMEAFIKQNNLTASVQFVGNVNHDDLPIYFHMADAFLLPARYEGFGIVIIEAQAAGCPIVTTRITGTQDVVSEENAILIPTQNAQALADGVEQIFTDPAATQKRIEQGLIDVQRFTEETMHKREIELYKDLLSHHKIHH